MAMDKIMSWGKCTIAFGKTGVNDVLSSVLTDIGMVKDKSTEFSGSAGDKKQMFAEGKELVAQYTEEGELVLKFALINPDLASIAKVLGVAAPTGVPGEERLTINSMVVTDNFSFVVSPVLIGATGLEIPKGQLSVTPKYGTEEGLILECEVTVLSTVSGSRYTLYKVK